MKIQCSSTSCHQDLNTHIKLILELLAQPRMEAVQIKNIKNKCQFSEKKKNIQPRSYQRGSALASRFILSDRQKSI